MHAPATVQHYMVAITTNGDQTDMLDLGKYSSSILVGTGLVNFIKEEVGGNTLLFMQNICSLDDYDIVKIEMPNPVDPAERHELDEMMGTLIEELQIMYPVLVPCIKINDDFNH
jgi:hypothetical protein